MRIKALFILFLIPQLLFSQNIFEKALKTFSDDAVLKNATWGFSAFHLSDNRQIVDVNSSTSLIPASVMKLYSTSAALILLGENYQFETHLLYTGFIDNKGILHGDLIIRGFGDPTLGSDRWAGTKPDVIFALWSKALAEKGIKGINGNITGDGTSWELNLAAGGWQYNDIGNYYACGAGGLNIIENSMRLFFEPSAKVGESARLIKTYPPLPQSAFLNFVTTAAKGSGDMVIVYGSPFAYPRIVRGSVPTGVKEFVVKASMPDPAEACASLFKAYLLSKGIRVNGKSRSINPFISEITDTNTQLLAINKSPYLKSIIKQTNYHSINIFAEALFKAVSFKISKSTDYSNATQMMIQFMKNYGINTDGLNIADGSGLSRTNLVTTEQLCRLLMLVKKDKRFDVFYESLPIAGENGTVKNFLKNKDEGTTYRIKSGFMFKVRAYAGFVSNNEGEMICFAFIVNNFNCSPAEIRLKMEKLLKLLPQLLQ